MKQFFFVWVLLYFSSGGLAATPEAGQLAPEFKLQASDGRTYTLSQFKGKKPVVIAWFPKAFTGGCTLECRSLQENREKLREAAYFAASCDTLDENTRFAKSLKAAYPILSDAGCDTAQQYGVVAGDRKYPARWTFYIDKLGIIRFIDKNVNPSTAGADIAAKLRELKLSN